MRGCGWRLGGDRDGARDQKTQTQKHRTHTGMRHNDQRDEGKGNNAKMHWALVFFEKKIDHAEQWTETATETATETDKQGEGRETKQVEGVTADGTMLDDGGWIDSVSVMAQWTTFGPSGNRRRTSRPRIPSPPNHAHQQ